MSLTAITGLVTGVSTAVAKIIDKLVPDPDLNAKIKAATNSEIMQVVSAQMQGAIQIIMAEASGESWLQRNWRPLLMLWFAGLVGAHWMGFTPANLTQETVDHLLTIVQIGIGGYVVGRSAEKVMREYKK